MQLYKDRSVSWTASKNYLLWCNQKENKNATLWICSSGVAVKSTEKENDCIIQTVLIQLFF